MMEMPIFDYGKELYRRIYLEPRHTSEGTIGIPKMILVERCRCDRPVGPPGGVCRCGKAIPGK